MNTERVLGMTRAAALTFAALLAMMLACTVFVSQAFAKQTVEAPIGVADDITRIHVDKMDADTHEYVKGAKMAIIHRDTGAVVDEWTTGEETHKLEKALDPDQVYILREVEAPEGYTKVADTTFKMNATEGTGITILDAGFADDPDRELSESYKVTLFDHLGVEQVVTETRNNSKTNTVNRAAAPKTGDETPLWLIGGLCVAGIIAIGVLEIPKRRMKD